MKSSKTFAKSMTNQNLIERFLVISVGLGMLGVAFLTIQLVLTLLSVE